MLLAIYDLMFVYISDDKDTTVV